MQPTGYTRALPPNRACSITSGHRSNRCSSRRLRRLRPSDGAADKIRTEIRLAQFAQLNAPYALLIGALSALLT